MCEPFAGNGYFDADADGHVLIGPLPVERGVGFRPEQGGATGRVRVRKAPVPEAGASKEER